MLLVASPLATSHPLRGFQRQTASVSLRGTHGGTVAAVRYLQGLADWRVRLCARQSLPSEPGFAF
jgi:hypothetical protein